MILQHHKSDKRLIYTFSCILQFEHKNLIWATGYEEVQEPTSDNPTIPTLKVPISLLRSSAQTSYLQQDYSQSANSDT